MAETMRPRAYGVSEVNNYLREYLAEDDLLTDLLVQGELSSYKLHSSGHIYFSLSEGGCTLSGAMFRAQVQMLNFEPQPGMEIAVWGSVGYYERDGRVQLYARSFFPVGAGAAETALDALKQKLAAEGLFDQERKQALPLLPRSLGVISGDESAAWADIRKVVDTRWPGLPLCLYPALVQGQQAPESISKALAKADSAGHDLLILGRGGGANEDLAAFNTELVARAVAACQTPLISAVGHEINTTLADLAADLRAATPSHAASLAVPQLSELVALLSTWQQRLEQAARQQLCGLEGRLRAVEASLKRLAADGRSRQGAALALLAAQLEALSPLAVLGRGYALCRDTAGRPIQVAASQQVGDKVEVLLHRGALSCRVEAVEEER